MGSATWTPLRTLPGTAYVDPATFADELERVFSHEWLCVGRAEELPAPGDHISRLAAGDPLRLRRGEDGAIEAALVGTDGAPVEIRCETWEGFVFVNLDDDAEPLATRLENDPEEPMQFARYGLGELRIGWPNAYPEVAANWKILIQNYNECLHCPTVHPELVRLVPVYRRGEVVDDPDSWGVPLADGATSMTATGTSDLPAFPGLDDDDRCRYYGCFVFPNLFIDLMPDVVSYAILWPLGPDRTTITEGYLFRPETIAAPGFDPSPIVEFSTLVMRQDIEVCERAQLGAGSRAFADGGVYPYQDRFVHDFDERYREVMAAR